MGEEPAGAPPRGEIGEPVARRAATSSSLRFISASGPPSCRRRFPLSPGASRALAGGGLEALRRDTGAFLAVELPEGEGAAPPTLRAVGSEEDLERIQTQLRSFE